MRHANNLWLGAASVTRRFVGRGNRLGGIRDIVKQWIHQNRENIPEVYLTTLVPAIRGVRVSVDLDVDHPFELPYGERCVVAALAAIVKPKTVFEFGTYTGATTRLLAGATSTDTRIHTIDLPDGQFTWGDVTSEVIGREFRNDPAAAAKVTQHRSNTRQFDFTPFHGKIDFVFVDASHEYHDVLYDSQQAFALRSPNGIIVWDDYQAGIPDVVDAVTDLAAGKPIVRVASTRLAVYGLSGRT